MKKMINFSSFGQVLLIAFVFALSNLPRGASATEPQSDSLPQGQAQLSLDSAEESEGGISIGSQTDHPVSPVSPDFNEMRFSDLVKYSNASEENFFRVREWVSENHFSVNFECKGFFSDPRKH